MRGSSPPHREVPSGRPPALDYLLDDGGNDLGIDEHLMGLGVADDDSEHGQALEGVVGGGAEAREMTTRGHNKGVDQDVDHQTHNKLQSLRDLLDFHLPLRCPLMHALTD